MIVRAAIGAFALFAAGSASAQSVTNCQRTGDQTFCYTTPGVPPPPPANFNPPEPFDGYRNAIETSERMNRLMQASRTARIGRLVAAGKCAEAEKEALRSGDFGLAQQVRGYCDSSPPK